MSNPELNNEPIELGRNTTEELRNEVYRLEEELKNAKARFRAEFNAVNSRNKPMSEEEIDLYLKKHKERESDV